ncbi:Gpr1 family protein [Favolaschia claudopus]|uniref:Gpr1 family protein n=1 Tax=Favolaschia claudopus TaxID=2862362 RepID=A0AAW0A3K9_9AGAR
MPVDAVTVIVDDQAFPAHSLPASRIMGNPGGFYPRFPSCYNTSMFVPFRLGKNDSSWAWALAFDGTSVALFGLTPPVQYNQTVGISDPSVDQTNITRPDSYRNYTYSASAYGGQIFTSGVVSDASQIQIGLSDANGLAIDYALVTAGSTTNLQGQTILVDDRNPEIFWDGNWTMRENDTLSIQYTLPSPQAYADPSRITLVNSTDSLDFIANVQPHANSTHCSKTVGDSFAFQFAGTSILVSGVTPGANSPSDWLLHMEFVLDENSTTRVFGSTSDPIKPHYIYFESPNLLPGNHTLVGRILTVVGSPLPAAQIDYITYKPSFLTVAEKPIFVLPHLNGTSAPVPSDLTSSDSSSQSKHHAVGAIVGGAVGGCLVVSCVLAIFWLLRRNRRRHQTELGTEPFTSTAPAFYQSDGPFPQLETSTHSKRLYVASSGSNFNAAALSQQQNNIAAEMRELQNSPVEARLRELQAQMDAIEVRMRDNAPPSYSGEA